MIKISSWICGTCLIVWIILFGIACAIEGIPPSSAWYFWGIISIITVGVAIGSFALSYLGGHIIRGNKGSFRLGVLISVLWVVVSFIALESIVGYWDWNYSCNLVLWYSLGYFWICIPKKENGKFIIVTYRDRNVMLPV